MVPTELNLQPLYELVQHAYKHLSMHCIGSLEPKHEINLSMDPGDQVARLVASWPPRNVSCMSHHRQHTHTLMTTVCARAQEMDGIVLHEQ